MLRVKNTADNNTVLLFIGKVKQNSGPSAVSVIRNLDVYNEATLKAALYNFSIHLHIIHLWSVPPICLVPYIFKTYAVWFINKCKKEQYLISEIELVKW